MTSPLAAQILTKLQSRRQAVRYTCRLGDVREFRAYCCNIDSDGIMGVAKEPVPIVSIQPNPICVGASVSWNISESYAPGSTLTSWSIDWDDASSDSGADFPNDTTSGTHIYASADTYDIEVTITEGTGRTQTSTVQVTVVECGDGPGSVMTDLWTYISTDGSGAYFIDWDEASPDWEGINTGLEGEALEVRHIAIDPATKHLAREKHVLWLATKKAVYKSTNGGSTWAEQELGDPSNLEFGDSPAATIDDIEFLKIILHPTDGDTVFVVAKGSA